MLYVLLPVPDERVAIESLCTRDMPIDADRDLVSLA